MRTQSAMFTLLLAVAFAVSACGASKDSQVKAFSGQFESYRAQMFSTAIGTICSGNQPTRTQIDFDMRECQGLRTTQLSVLQSIGPLSVQVSDDGTQIAVDNRNDQLSGSGVVDAATGAFEFSVYGDGGFKTYQGCSTHLLGKAHGVVTFGGNRRVERIDVAFDFNYGPRGDDDPAMCAQITPCDFRTSIASLNCNE